MQIVIDIPSEMYNDIKSGEDGYSNYVHTAVRNGAPLPKGHGRLIDADALGEKLNKYTEAPYQYALKVFNDASTIIEADNTESEG